MTEMIRQLCASVHCCHEPCWYRLEQIWQTTNEQGQSALDSAFRAAREHYLQTGHTRMMLDHTIVYFPDYEHTTEIDYYAPGHADRAPVISLEEYYK